MVKAQLGEQTAGGQTYYAPPGSAGAEPAGTAYLLPAFDEFLLGYTDRTAGLDNRFSPRVISSNGIFYATLVIDGAVLGAWKRTVKKDTVIITLAPFARLTKAQQQAAAQAAERYGAYLGPKARLDKA